MFDSSASSIGYFDVDLLDTYFAGTTKTLTNKTLTSPTVSGLYLSDSGFSVEGSSADANETTVSFTNPTADRTITFPDATGNVAVFTTAPTAAITDGTSGQVLTTNGSGVLSFADAGGSPDLYADNYTSGTKPTATGNDAVAIGLGSQASGTGAVAIGYESAATQNYSFAAAISGGLSYAGARAGNSIAMGYRSTTNNTGSVAIGYSADASGNYSVSLGTSRTGGTDSFAAVIDNNTSSYGATGANSVAMGKQAKAQGSKSFAVGNSAHAVNAESTAIGDTAIAQGNKSIALGVFTTANGTNSVALGHYSKADEAGKLAFAAGRFSAAGDAQTGIYVLRSDTTDATAEALTTDNSTASTTNQIILENEGAMTFTGTVVVREDATDGDDYAGWEIKGVIMRGTGVATTTLGVGIVNSLYHTSGLASASVALSADTTNGGLKIEVTGIAATNLRWVATVHTSEVVNA